MKELNHMTHAEEFATNKLKEFVKNLKYNGISCKGVDIDTDLQFLIASIVEDYIEEVEHGED